MTTFEEFTKQVTDLYQHLYDLVYLRTSSVLELLVKDKKLSKKEKSWELHKLLLNAIEELNPGIEAPAFSREWRRYRLMKYHYTEGLDAQKVSAEIAISRRQYYREHNEAIKAIAEVLWQQADLSNEVHTDDQEEWLNTLHSEAVLLAQTDQNADLGEVINSVISLFNEKLETQKLKIQVDLLNNHQCFSVSKYLLRQIFIELFSFFTSYLEHNTIFISSSGENGETHIDFLIEKGFSVSQKELAIENIVSSLEVMCKTINASFTFLSTNDMISGFRLDLPKEECWNILAIDDNKDILALFERYFERHPKIHPANCAERS